MNTRLIVLFVSFAFCAAEYSDCGSAGTIENIAVSGCSKDDAKCVLKKNTNASITIDFIPKSGSSVLNSVVHGVILGVPVPFPLPNANGCTDCGVSCPLVAGQKYSYKATLPVLRNYPRLSVDVKWQLQDESSKDIICALIPAQIK